ncbi:MAG: 50S ribosomal protein L15 [Saprospiraceae bacterium]|nr:50S ribosomal protein L15 [Saprospiraceae bacterium]
MELHNLKPASGAVKKEKRIGRGPGSGHGGTSTRGHKGDKARSGSRLKRNFEGGQTPMQRRLPKRGFKNINRVDYIPLNLGKLESLVQKTGVTTLDMPFLLEQGIAKSGEVIKILGTGSLTSKISVSAHAVSAAAKAAIEAIGGSVTIVSTHKTASTQE